MEAEELQNALNQPTDNAGEGGGDGGDGNAGEGGGGGIVEAVGVRGDDSTSEKAVKGAVLVLFVLHYVLVRPGREERLRC